MSNSRISRISPPVWHKLVPVIYVSKHAWNVYAAWVLFTEAVGALAGWLTRSGIQLYTQTVTQPPLARPLLSFPSSGPFCTPCGHWRGPGISQCLLPLPHPGSGFVSSPAGGQLLLASAFFLPPGLWAVPGLAGLAVGSDLGHAGAFRRGDPLAAWLQLPYLLWVTSPSTSIGAFGSLIRNPDSFLMQQNNRAAAALAAAALG